MNFSIFLVLSSVFVCSFGNDEESLNEIASKLPNIIDNINSELPPGIPPVNMSSIPTIEEGEEILEQKCDKNGGNSSFDNFMLAREEVNNCLKSIIDYKELQVEIERAKPTGDLDIVFSKYCNKSPTIKECVTNFTTALDPCLEPKEKETKKVFQNVSESLLDFVCYKGGDRIALFIAEGGPECISDKKEAIQHCMNITLSKFIPKEDITANNIPQIKLELEECTALKDMHLCVIAELEKCNETTPSNIVDALVKFMIKQTPCNNFNLYPDQNSGSSSTHYSYVVGAVIMSLVSTFLFR